MKVKSLSRVQLFGTPWTTVHQAPLSMGFPRQEYWSELPFPSPGDLPNPGIEPRSPTLRADALPSEPPGKTHRKPIKPRDKELALFTEATGALPVSGGSEDAERLPVQVLETRTNK